LRRQTLPEAGSILKSSFELFNQSRKGFRLLMRGEVSAGQPRNLEAKLAQSFLCQVDLPMLQGIFIAATH